MNEPFLLSNLIDLQEIDNEIYKIDNWARKKTLEIISKNYGVEQDS